jgi:hypothetical protein
MRSGASWTSCSSTSWRGEVFAGGPAARRPAFRSSKPKPKPKPKPKQRLSDTSGGGGHGRAGHAVNPAPRSGPAAGGCAFGRLRSSASQAKRPHPWGLDGAIHGANGPARPCPPPLDTLPRARSIAFGSCQPWLATAFEFAFFLLTLNFRSRSARAGNCHPSPSNHDQSRRQERTLLLRILPTAVGVLPWPQFDGRQQRRRRRDAAQCQCHGATNTQCLEVRAE